MSLVCEHVEIVLLFEFKGLYMCYTNGLRVLSACDIQFLPLVVHSSFQNEHLDSPDTPLTVNVQVHKWKNILTFA